MEIQRLRGGFPTSGPDRDELNKLHSGAGECLRLLRSLRFAPPLAGNRGVGGERIASALHELQNESTSAASSHSGVEDANDLNAQNGTSLPPMASIRDEEMKARYQANRYFNECPWVGRHSLVPVENGSADVTPEPDEGNNCLLVSILQHATGNYADRFHADMTKTLREAMVAQFPTIRHGEPLYSDTEAVEWVRNTVNALYDRDLQFVCVGFKSAQQQSGEGIAPFMSGCSAGGTEPALIWEKGTHFEALVTHADAPPAVVPTRLEELEQATGVVQRRLQNTLASADPNGNPALLHALVGELNACLQTEMCEVQRLMQTASRPAARFSADVTDGPDLLANAPDGEPSEEVRRLLYEIAYNHRASLCRK